jgi:hypothetical protein
MYTLTEFLVRDRQETLEREAASSALARRVDDAPKPEPRRWPRLAIDRAGLAVRRVLHHSPA